MSSDKVKLRGHAKRRREVYPLGELPEQIIFKIARLFIHRLAIGQSDISGDDFGAIFGHAISGEHRQSPLGIADVCKNNCAWSVKTVKGKPLTAKRVRLISGRNSPDYSSGIKEVKRDANEIGREVLRIWNARVNEALDEFADLRIIVCIRNFSERKFLVFEEEAGRFTPQDYVWKYNSRNNLEGHEKTSEEHRFTWQPHGSQFTIIRSIPAHARKFSISETIPIISQEQVLKSIEFSKTWVTIENNY